MSSGSGRSSQNSSQPPLDRSLEEALERAKKLAATAPGQKRSNSEELNYTDTKRPNLDGGNMAGMGMGGPIGIGGNGGVETAVETMEVPDNAVGLVIGRGGENISMIQQQSGARVQMSGESNNGYRQATIQGTRPAIDKARQLISEVVERNSRNMSQNGGGGTITTEVLVPGNKCGLVIGKGGETIKSLQESLGVKMLLVQENQAISMAPKPLRIMGFPDKVENAKRVVEQLLNNDDGFRGMGPQRSIGEVIVPRSSVGIIIGKGGETIKRLAAETGAKIQFKPDDDPSTPDRCAVIQGTPEQINRATQMISDLVTRGAQGGMGGGGGNPNIFYMHVPANKTGLVIGKGGDTIKQICAESGAHVELSRDPMPNANEKVFIIKGSEYQIHHAQHIIRIKVGDIQPGTPLPPFQGSIGGVQMGGGNPYGPTQYGGGDQFGAQGGGQSQWGQNVGGQDASAWAQYYSQQQTGYTAAAQPGFQAQSQPYQGVGGQPQQHLQQNVNPAGQQPMVGGGAPAAAPSINPQTGQPDYSAQWCEYYRSMGMHEQASMIEAQMKQQQQPAQGARPQQAYYNS